MELIEKERTAKECLVQEKYSEAIALYEECIYAAPKEMSNYWKLGLALVLEGKELEAQSLWLQVIVQGEVEEVEAKTVELIKVLEAEGARCLESSKFWQAEKIYYQIIEQEPNRIEAYINLGNAVLSQGRIEEAIAYYQQAITLEPSYDLAYYHLGYALQSQGRIEEAIAYYQQYLTRQPLDAGANYNLGHALQTQGFLEGAIACYQQVLNIDPNNYQTINNLGAAFQMQDKLEEALNCYQKLITLKPNDARAFHNLGRVFQKQGKVEEAIAYYQQTLIFDPNQPIACNDLGTIFHAQGLLDKAIAYYEKAFNLDSNYALAHYNLGVLLMENSQFEKAIGCFNRAIEINPNYADAHWNRGLILLKWGDYERGFAEYEWRWRREQTPPPPFPQPRWAGEELEGKTILLYAEQGFGDTIQFIRYAPLVQARGGIVVVECHEPLVRLLKTISSIDRVIARETTLPEFDVHVPLMSLPYIFGTTLETVPNQVPYLNYDQSPRLSTEPSSLMKVGIVWAGNPDFAGNHQRSCTLNHFLGILDTPGVAFYSLQKGIAVEELAQLSQKVISQVDDFADTAAVIAQLDLIITVDTAVAHLAGALGKPVWVLLAFNPDWRWMLEKEDSPWYPSMRLFRQRQSGDWAEVFARVEAALLQKIQCQ